MIVLDASVMASLVGDDGTAGHVARARAARAGHLVAPDLVDVESVAVLRKRWRTGDLTAHRFRTAVDDLVDLPVERVPTRMLMPRAYELRANVTPYDAVYVALAEAFGVVLVTADARLARSPGLHCRVEVLSA